MSGYKSQTQLNYKTEFINQTKLVLKADFSRNPTKHEQYKHKIVTAFNDYIGYIATYFSPLPNDSDIEAEIKYVRDKLKKCYDALKIENELPSNLLDLVDISELPKLDQPATALPEPSSVKENTPILENPLTEKTLDKSKNQTADNPSTAEKLSNLTSSGTEPNLDNSQLNKTDNSTNLFSQLPVNLNKNEMEQTQFLGLAAKTLSNNYSGDPVDLPAFINSVKFLKQVGAAHLEILKVFVMTKLTGKALQSVPLNPDDIDSIINALEANIKVESSKVVEGKMMALKLDNAKTTDFTKEAEKLADALQHSLITEGISQAKAKSMAVEKTVEMCRQTAKSNLVRSVLASSTFNTPQEVVAKFVVESANDMKEKQIFKFSQQQNKPRGNFRGNYRNQNQNQNRNFRNNFNNGRNFNGNFNGNFNNNFNGNRNRGRGRGRGYFNRNQNDRFSVRLTNSENLQAPSGDRRVQEGQIVTFQRVNEN